jgi:tight adherence protein B
MIEGLSILGSLLAQTDAVSAPTGQPSIMIRVVATLLAGAAAFIGALSIRLPMKTLIRRQEEDFHQVLTELFLFDVTPRQLTYIMFAGAVVAGLILAMLAFHADAGLMGLVLAFLAGTAMGYWVPRLVILYMQRVRHRKLNEQIIDGLVTLANGMRAGLNLVQSMQLIEKNTQPPISQEFGLMLREFEHGTSVDEVLRRASARIKLHNYKLLFAAMETARMRGGNLPDTLDRLGRALREILRLEEKVKSLTSANRTSARFMGLMPLVVGGIYYAIEPSWMKALLDDQWGLVMIVIAGVFWVGGFLWIRKIVSFEI